MALKGKRGKLGAKTKLNLLGEDEIRRVLEKYEGDEISVVYTLAFTGMRVSELIHMRKDWVDWEEGLIRISESQPCDAHYECRCETKRRGKIIKRSCIWRVKDFDALSIQGFMGWKSVRTADEYIRRAPEADSREKVVMVTKTSKIRKDAISARAHLS